MASSASETTDRFPTRDSLLERLKNLDDGASWSDFFQRYWKFVYQVARQSGLTHHESEEVVQETVITVSRRIPEFHYDPKVCSFKTWLQNLTRWRIVDQLRKRQRANRSQSASTAEGDRPPLLDTLPDPASIQLGEIWDQEWREHLFRTAVQRVKGRVAPEQYQMFDLYVLKQHSVREVMRELEVGAAAVYLAKHRVSALIRKEVKNLAQTFG